jgi:RNA polymerase sigma factor for flagellar operon FliA
MSLPASCYDDFLSAAYLGLIEAADRFDPNCLTEFRTFAYQRIRGAIIDAIRKDSQFNGKAYRYAKALESSEILLDELSHRTNNSKSSDAILAAIMDFSAKAAVSQRLAFGDPDQLAAGVTDPTPSSEEEMIQREQSAILRRCLDELPEKERMVLIAHYYHELSLVQTAEEIVGLSKSWTSRVHANALTLLKEKILAAYETDDGTSNRGFKIRRE